MNDPRSSSAWFTLLMQAIDAPKREAFRTGNHGGGLSSCRFYKFNDRRSARKKARADRRPPFLHFGLGATPTSASVACGANVSVRQPSP